MQLSQKESSLLKDMQNHEKVCIAKYNNYAQQAEDPQLQQIFNAYAQTEQQHFDTIERMLQGQIPNTTQGQGQNQTSGQVIYASQGLSSGPWQSQTSDSSRSTGLVNESDALLCSDALMTEKFVSGAYDTVVFESANPVVRQTVQHIQDEEQQHGDGLFNYMNQHGMYQVQ